MFLHLSHPFALQKFSALVAHVRQYRAYLGSLTAKGQKAQIARGILSDLIDNSGVDFNALDSVLTTSLPEARTLDSTYHAISLTESFANNIVFQRMIV